MNRVSRFFLRLHSFLFLLVVTVSIWASPVAIVEEVSPGLKGVSALSFMEPGEKIYLESEEMIVLGYFRSCLREKVQGGTITIGQDQSEVDNGLISRFKLDCSGGSLALAADQAVHSAAIALRDIDFDAEPAITVFDISPVLHMPKSGRVVIKRIDEFGERYKVRLPKSDRRTVLDLASEKIELTPGGIYMVSVGGLATTFKVSEDAGNNQEVLLDRIVPF